MTSPGGAPPLCTASAGQDEKIVRAAFAGHAGSITGVMPHICTSPARPGGDGSRAVSAKQGGAPPEVSGGGRLRGASVVQPGCMKECEEEAMTHSEKPPTTRTLASAELLTS